MTRKEALATLHKLYDAVSCNRFGFGLCKICYLHYSVYIVLLKGDPSGYAYPCCPPCLSTLVDEHRLERLEHVLAGASTCGARPARHVSLTEKGGALMLALTQHDVAPLITLRPYQETCVERVLDAYQRTPKGGRALLVLPTGGGKTLVFAEIAGVWG